MPPETNYQKVVRLSNEAASLVVVGNGEWVNLVEQRRDLLAARDKINEALAIFDGAPSHEA